jgi:hypothetical protein
LRPGLGIPCGPGWGSRCRFGSRRYRSWARSSFASNEPLNQCGPDQVGCQTCEFACEIADQAVGVRSWVKPQKAKVANSLAGDFRHQSETARQLSRTHLGWPHPQRTVLGSAVGMSPSGSTGPTIRLSIHSQYSLQYASAPWGAQRHGGYRHVRSGVIFPAPEHPVNGRELCRGYLESAPSLRVPTRRSGALCSTDRST